MFIYSSSIQSLILPDVSITKTTSTIPTSVEQLTVYSPKVSSGINILDAPPRWSADARMTRKLLAPYTNEVKNRIISIAITDFSLLTPLPPVAEFVNKL